LFEFVLDLKKESFEFPKNGRLRFQGRII